MEETGSKKVSSDEILQSAEEEKREKTEEGDPAAGGRGGEKRETHGVRIPFSGARQSFAARMGDAGYVAGRRYDAIKNAFLSYRPAAKRGRTLRTRVTAGGESFCIGRKTVAKLCLVSGYLRLFLALDPAAYNVQKYHHKDYSGVARYAKLPFMIKLSSDRQVRNAVALVDALMRENGFVPDETYIPSDQAGVFAVRGRRRRSFPAQYPGALPLEEEAGFGLAEEDADEGEEEIPVPAAGEEPAEEKAECAAPGARLPRRASVTDREGNRIGKVRRSVWYDAEGNGLGSFRKEDDNVFFYAAAGGREGYVDGNDNVLSLSDGYLATLKRFPWAVLLVILILIALATALTGVLSAYLMSRSQDLYAPVLFIADEEGVSWEETENIPVFMNESFGDTVIAPGMSGSYRFVFENRNENALDFSFAFSEENEYGIGLVYRLKRDGVYISGEEHAATDDLGVSGMTIEAHSSSVFELEWQWLHGDEADTAAGENGAQYTLHISFSAAVAG